MPRSAQKEGGRRDRLSASRSPARNSFDSAGRSYGSDRLRAEDDERAVVALGAERLGAAGARQPGADDHDGPGRAHAACTSVTRMAAIGHESQASSTAGSSVWPTRTVAVPAASSSKMSRCELGTGAEAATQ